MNAVSNATPPQFRDVTPEEIAQYRQHGWVKLNKFLPRSEAENLRSMGQELMGEDGARNPPPKAFSYSDPILRPIIDHVGRGAKALMARRAPVGIRYFTDYFAVKLPSGSSPGHGGDGASDWHQDFAASASDRSGGMVFWMALTDMPPELGTMRFLNGSHRQGVMGHYATYGQGNLLDSYPELLDECTDTGQLTYSAGDVTVHSNMAVHAAGANLTDKPRWTYIVIVNPADACWTGGPADAFETTGLTLHQEMTDDRFPVIA